MQEEVVQAKKSFVVDTQIGDFITIEKHNVMLGDTLLNQ
jgi:hypothetical protein